MRSEGTTDEDLYRAAEDAVWAHRGVTPRERWVDVDGAQVRVQEVGDPHGPPVLFVHGGSIAGTSWADLAASLPSLRCLVLDRPGCGLSEPPPTPVGLKGLPDHAANLLVAVLDGLGIDRAHLVATSMGGYFALRTALVHPERVDRLVLLSWVFGARPTQLPLVMRLAARPSLGRVMARLPVSERIVRSTLRQIGLGAALDAGRIPDVGIAWNAALANHTATRVHEFGLSGGEPLPRQVERLALSPDELARISAPTRVVFGTDDPMGTLAAMQDLADGLPDAKLDVWEGAGHAVWLDRLESAVDVVRDHLGGGSA